MIWLKALWNCVKRGVKALVISIGITLGILLATTAVVMLGAAIGHGIELLVGEGFWHAVGDWIGNWGPWILVGLVVVMFGMLALDSVNSEKIRLERREYEQVSEAD